MKFSADEITFLHESNLIEGVTDADSLLQAIRAWEYLKGQKKLTSGVILKTHKILMLHHKLRPNERGYFREVPVWVGGREGRPWYVIGTLIEQWCINVEDLLVNRTAQDSEQFLKKTIHEHHIGYETIHPFVDGNGRTGRMFMNWERLKVGLPIEIIWNEEKQDYYEWFK